MSSNDNDATTNNNDTTTMNEEEKVTDATPTKLFQVQTPVPSDIDISQYIVKHVGLLSMNDIAKQYVLVYIHIMFFIMITLSNEEKSCFVLIALVVSSLRILIVSFDWIVYSLAHSLTRSYFQRNKQNTRTCNSNKTKELDYKTMNGFLGELRKPRFV